MGQMWEMDVGDMAQKGGAAQGVFGFSLLLYLLEAVDAKCHAQIECAITPDEHSVQIFSARSSA